MQTQKWAQKIGQEIRSRRKNLELSLEDLSRLSGATIPTLSHIERGTRDVKLSTLVSLAGALKIDLPKLFGWTNGKNRAAAKPTTDAPIGYDLDDD